MAKRKRVMETGELRRVLHDEIGNGLDNAAMKLEALRVTGMMHDLREMQSRVEAYEAIIKQVLSLISKAHEMVDSALLERPSDKLLQGLSEIFKRILGIVEMLGSVEGAEGKGNG